ACVVVQWCRRPETRERAFELTDIGIDVGGEEQSNVMRQVDALHVRLLFEDGDPCLHVGRLDISNETPFKTIAQAFLEIWNLLGELVGGHDDLTARFIERVEGMEEFL